MAGHRIDIIERKQLIVDGVRHVDNFDEKEITLATTMGMLSLKGEGMHITQLNLDEGHLEVEGHFNVIAYVEGRENKGLRERGKGFLERVFK